VEKGVAGGLEGKSRQAFKNALNTLAILDFPAQRGVWRVLAAATDLPECTPCARFQRGKPIIAANPGANDSDRR